MHTVKQEQNWVILLNRSNSKAICWTEVIVMHTVEQEQNYDIGTAVKLSVEQEY
jgi:hypothetical protein